METRGGVAVTSFPDVPHEETMLDGGRAGVASSARLRDAVVRSSEDVARRCSARLPPYGGNSTTGCGSKRPFPGRAPTRASPLPS